MTPAKGNKERMMMTDVPKATAGAGGNGIRLVRWLVVVNLGFVALQALSAGFLMSGYAPALKVHAIVAVALQFGALVQAVAAVVQWRRRRVPAWVPAVSIGLFVIVFLQVGFGHRRLYWLHVPIGVGIFGALTRQVNRLDNTTVTLRRSASCP
jgi:hypothetical protein